MKLDPRRPAAIVAQSVAVLLALEVAMIVLEPHVFGGIYLYDPDTGFRVRPGERQSNSLGFFDADYVTPAPADVVRVVVVGDSFSWNGGLEGNYTSILERRFEERYGWHRVDVVNTGYPGTNTREQLAMLEKFAMRYEPDIVLLGFFLGNDFLDAQPYRKRIVVNDTFFEVDARELRTFWGYPLVPQWRLRQFARQKIKELGVLLSLRATAPPEGSGQAFPESQFLGIEQNRLTAFHRSFERDPRVAVVKMAVSDMQALLSASDVEFHVALYPDEFQVDAELLERVYSASDLDRSEFDLDLLPRLLIEHLRAESIPYVDLTPTFRGAGP